MGETNKQGERDFKFPEAKPPVEKRDTKQMYLIEVRKDVENWYKKIDESYAVSIKSEDLSISDNERLVFKEEDLRLRDEAEVAFNDAKRRILERAREVGSDVQIEVFPYLFKDLSKIAVDMFRAHLYRSMFDDLRVQTKE